MSYGFVPSIMLAPAPLAAKQWKNVFDAGKKAGPILAIISALSTGYVAYNRMHLAYSHC